MALGAFSKEIVYVIPLAVMLYKAAYDDRVSGFFWRFKWPVLVAAGGLVFIGGDDGAVRAIDGASGSLKWTFRTGGPVLQSPTIYENRALVGSGDGYVYCLEAATGKELWRFLAARALPRWRSPMA